MLASSELSEQKPFEFLVKISIYPHVSPKFSRNISIFLHDWFMFTSAENQLFCQYRRSHFGLSTFSYCKVMTVYPQADHRDVTRYMWSHTCIRKYLSRESTEILVHAFITSLVDYCNSLLYGLPNYQLNKLQRLLNSSARLVCNAPRFCHISPLLRGLH